MGDCTTYDGRPVFVLVSTHYGWVYGLLYCVVSLFMTFGLFNVIVAIYIENTMAAAKFNDEHQKRQRLLDKQMFTEKATQLVEFIWRVNTPDASSGRKAMTLNEVSLIDLTPDFFEELRKYTEFQDILRDLDIADEDQLDLFDTLDVDGGGTIDLEELITGIAKLRGGARRSDIVGVGLVVRSVQLAFNEFQDTAMKLMQSQHKRLRSMESHLARTTSTFKLELDIND